MGKRLYQVIWDDEAKVSLRKIYQYIRKRESSDRAKIVCNKIKSLASRLGYMPQKFSKEPFWEHDMGDVRFKVIWSYKIVYEVEDEKVIILDIFHTSRYPQNLRKKY